MKKYLPLHQYTIFIPTILLGAYATFVLLPHLDIPLVSYDEAWYASIAHNIVEKSEILGQSFNGSAYYDHPPLGFWLISLSIALFGETEFSIRLPSILAAITTLALVYKLARSQTSKYLSPLPAMMLASSLWFAYRARSANLDVLLTFFMTASVWSIKQVLEDPSSKVRQLVFAGALFGSIMTKTLVGLGIAPVLIYLYVINSKSSHRQNINQALFRSLSITLCCTAPWYLYNTVQHQDFLRHHFLTIGTRKGSDNTLTLTALNQTLLYFRSGIGKWYYPTIAGAILSVPLWLKTKYDKDITTNMIWLLGIGAPFFLSAKTEVWHLIPLYIPLFLLTTSVIYKLLSTINNKKVVKYFSISITICAALIALKQTADIMPLLSASTEYNHKDIALRSQSISTPVAINAPFLPTFVYYSRLSNVHPLFLDPTSYATITACLEKVDCNTVFVINKSDRIRLEEDGVRFKIRDNNQEFFLIQNVNE